MASFASPTELSVYTQGKISSSDPRSQPVLDAISQAIRKYCGWHIAPVQEDTLVIDGAESVVLSLPTLHVTEVDSVSIDGTEVDSADFEWSALGELKLKDYPYCWPEGYRNIEVTFTHGFSEYEDVKQVVLQVAAGALASPMGATREQAGSVSISWALTGAGTSGGVSFLGRDYSILDKYKIPSRW